MSSSAERFAAHCASLKSALARSVLGQEEVIDEVLVCLFAGGHALLEGAPGLGKTLLVRTLASAMDLRFSRIQFTPDLMPGDIVGTNVVVTDPQGQKRFELAKGPIFGQLVLADEVNRATPKTQSALLEAMAEQTVTISGTKHALPDPFFVLATENPIEMDGTYPLPEAQLDRFLFKILVPAPDEDTLVSILGQTTGNARPEIPQVIDVSAITDMRRLVRDVHIAEPLTRYIARLIRASDPALPQASPTAQRMLRYGGGVRGGQAIVMAAKVFALIRGSGHVSHVDIRRAATPALRHRLIPNFEAEAEGLQADELVSAILSEVPELPASVRDLGVN